MAAAVATLPAAALAQIPSKLLPGANPQQLPPGVKRVGSLEIAPVRFEYSRLFDVTGPVIRNREAPGNLVPVEIRAAQIEDNLRHVLAEDPSRSGSAFGGYDTFYSPDSFRVDVETVNGRPVLMAGDEAHPRDLTLLTVTEDDARYYSVPAAELANRWRRQLDERLGRALESRQPAAFRRHIRILPGLLGAIAVVTAGLLFARKRLRKWRAELARRDGEEAAGARTDKARLLAAVFQWTADSLLWAVWLGGLTWMLSWFPATAPVTQWVWRRMVVLAVVWFVAGLIQRVAVHIIRRFAHAWSSVKLRPHEDASRLARRIPTISRVVEGVATVIIYLLVVAASLNVLGVPASSLLTAGALIAFAVTFAAQSVIKDFTGGVLILAEDQFAIGDYITVGAISGVVERMSLRATQVRKDDGRLATIPNGVMSIVENSTRDWARVTTTVEVAYDSDVERVLAVIAGAADELYHDPQWSAAILEPPRVLGIDALSHAGISIRTVIRTVAAQRMFVRLEFNRRVRLALEAHGIAIGMPQQAFRPGAAEEGVPAAAGAEAPGDATSSRARGTRPPR